MKTWFQYMWVLVWMAAERTIDTFSETGKKYDYRMVDSEEAEEIKKSINSRFRRVG